MNFGARLSYQADTAFSQAHRRAFLHRALGVLRRQQPAALLSFDTVRDKLRIRGQHFVGLQTIPIDKIVGSVGRYHEFNRAFLPEQEHIRERWKKVYAATHTEGLPPIDVYKIGEAYFVRDGHHRVSVLKEVGATVVEAFVTEFDSPVPLSSDVVEGDLDQKEEYAVFLLQTGLAAVRPEQRIELTLPGQYQKLLEHIAVHRYFLGLREMRDISESEAVGRWYDEVYLPLIKVIRETRVLDQFPGRSEADLYLWLIEHRHYLSEEYGRVVPYQEAAADFARVFAAGPRTRRFRDSLRRVFSGRVAHADEDKHEPTGRDED